MHQCACTQPHVSQADMRPAQSIDDHSCALSTDMRRRWIAVGILLFLRLACVRKQLQESEQPLYIGNELLRAALLLLHGNRWVRRPLLQGCLHIPAQKAARHVSMPGVPEVPATCLRRQNCDV